MSADHHSSRESGDPGRLRSIALFATTAAIFFAWRMSFDIIQDDAPRVVRAMYDWELHSSEEHLVLGEPGALRLAIGTAFGGLSKSGYRPLSAASSNLGVSFFVPGGPPSWIWIALASLVIGGLATAFYRVAHRFTGSKGWSLFAFFIFVASPPYMCAASVIVAGLQAIVPLLLCSTLLLYWAATDESSSTGKRRWALVGLALLLLFGPWFREFIGLSSILVAGLELERRRRPTKLVALSALTLLHAIFPTTLVRLVAFPDLPLLPISRLGSLGTQVAAPGIRWDALPTLFLLVPSALIVLATLGLVARIATQGFRQAFMNKDIAFLTVWFLLSFVPMLRVFTTHVHLLYSLVPATMLASILMRDLFVTLDARFPRARLVAASLVLFAVCDQFTNCVAAHVSTVRIIEGYREVADVIGRTTRKGDVIVVNVLGAEQIRYHGQGRNTLYFTVESGVPDEFRVVDEPHELQRLIDRTRPKNDVYFLAIEFDHMPHKSFYHKHKYVRFDSIATEDLGIVQNTRARFPILDPLKSLTPRRFIPFPATPDLVDDFYLGPDRDGNPFWREVYAEYHLHRVTGTTVDPWLPTLQYQLVQETDAGYNILECNGRYFALHRSESAFDVARASMGKYEPWKCHAESSLDSLHSWIDRQSQKTVGPDRPTLVESNYKTFDIVRLRDRFYGVPHVAETADIDRRAQVENEQVIQGKTIAKVKARIAAASATGRRSTRTN